MAPESAAGDGNGANTLLPPSRANNLETFRECRRAAIEAAVCTACRTLGSNGGEGGIRTLDELLTHTPLAGERLQPLGHLSGSNGPGAAFSEGEWYTKPT